MNRLFLTLALGLAGIVMLVIARPFPLDPASADDTHAYRALIPMVSRGGSLPTAVPTNTATIPPTAAPTQVPTVAPTPNPGTVFVRNYSAYEDSIGALWVVGEVVNPLPYPVEFVKVTGRFYSSGGALLATDFSYSDRRTIPAGQDSSFSVLLFDPPPGIAYFELAVTDFDTDVFFDPPVGLQAQVTNSYTDSIGVRHDVGTVNNSSGFVYEFVQVYIAYYNSAGVVIRVGFTYTDPTDLAPGATGTFEIIEWGADELPIASHRIWVDASYE